jgi:hypothetical protein
MIVDAEWCFLTPWRQKQGKQCTKPTKSTKPKFFCCIRAWRIKNVLRSTVDLAARRSTTDSGFQTPSTVLLLTVGGGGGGGGSGMVIKKCAQIYGHHDSAQMDGLQAIPDPLDRSAFNGGGGGGSRMRRFFWRALSQRVIHPLHQTSSTPCYILHPPPCALTPLSFRPFMTHLAHHPSMNNQT